MSTQDMELLRLYRDDKLYNGSRYKVYQNDKTMDDYLGNPDYEKYVNYKSISEPIPINEAIKNCDEYTYGSITNEGKTYYFFVDNISTDAYYKTTIEYTIDWWSTNWNNIRCTKAHITRQNKEKPLYIEQPVSQKNLSIDTLPLTNDFCIWATYIPSGDKSPSFINYIILEGNKRNVGFVEEGYWQSILRIPHADVKDCFVVPYFTIYDLNPDFDPLSTGYDGVNTFYAANSAYYEGDSHDDKLGSAVIKDLKRHPTVNQIVYDIGDAGYYKVTERNPYKFEQIYIEKDGKLKRYIAHIEDIGVLQQDTCFYMFNIEDYKAPIEIIPDYNYRQFEITPTDLTFTSTEVSKQGVSDWNGNSIWEAPIDTTLTFKVVLTLGLSHIMLEFIPIDSNNSQSIVGCAFSYDCRHPGLFLDSYQDYVLKNRDYDIEMRKIQTEKQNILAWSSVAENIGFGKAFGKNIGGVAAGVGSVIEAGTTYLINSRYDPKIQEQYDLRYARMTDQISLVGDSITDVMNTIDKQDGILRKYMVNVSDSALQRYNNDITTNGYYSDEVTPSLSDSYFATGRVIQAENVVVEGACNVIGKQQVVSRLMNGVEFI